MGMGIHSSKSTFERKPCYGHQECQCKVTVNLPKVQDDPPKQKWPNPRADNYEIITHQQIGNYLIIQIKYLDCTNYEGAKILVFDNITMADLKEQKLIDPHFCDNPDYYSPIARFIPTMAGIIMATRFCKMMAG